MMEDIQSYIADFDQEDNVSLIQHNIDIKRKVSKIIFCEDFEGEEIRNIRSEGSLYNSEIKKQKRESPKSCECLCPSKSWNGNSEFEEKLSNSLWNLRKIQGRKPIIRYLESTRSPPLAEKTGEIEQDNEKRIPPKKVSNSNKKEQKDLILNTQKWESVNDFSDFAVNLTKCKDGDSLSNSNKKRGSSIRKGKTKKPKLDFDTKMDTDISPEKCLKTEIELENSHIDTPVKRRSINAIIEELELISRKCKEGYVKYKFPVQWGSTIVKNCSEKWDSQYIPTKILERYQQYFKARKSQDSSLLIENFESSNEIESDVKFTEEKNNGSESEKSAEIEDSNTSKLKELENYQTFSSASKSKQMGEDANYSFNSDAHEKMTLRSRNVNRIRLEEDAAEASSEYFTKEKQAKKNIKPNKDKIINHKRQLIVMVERCKIPVEKDSNDANLDSNKNYGMEWKMEDPSSHKSQLETGKCQHEDTSTAEMSRINEEDYVTCPICDIKFKKSLIEGHATECASATFPD